MECPECHSHHIHKNGQRKGKLNYICVKCGRQLSTEYQHRGYSDDVKGNSWKMYVNGMGFRARERITGVSPTTIMDWVQLVVTLLPDADSAETIPEVGELDELETFVVKKNPIWLWTAVDHFPTGILGWVVGDYSAETFMVLWQTISWWPCYFWVRDGNTILCQIYSHRGSQC